MGAGATGIGMSDVVTATGASASRLLMRDRDAIARAATAALYAAVPALLERHGERGRDKCLQDMHYTIDHLIPAVDFGDPAMFSRYVEWLDGVLRARNVDTRDVVRCLELLRDQCAERFPRSEADAIGAILDAGLAVFTG